MSSYMLAYGLHRLENIRSVQESEEKRTEKPEKLHESDVFLIALHIIHQHL